MIDIDWPYTALAKPIAGWTDYPIVALGDVERQEAPIRPCMVMAYDGDKYAIVEVGGVRQQMKLAYVYTTPGRAGEVLSLTHEDAMMR